VPFVACGANTYEHEDINHVIFPLTLESVLDIANQRREDIDKPGRDKLLAVVEGWEPSLDDISLIDLSNRPPQRFVLSTEEAIQDTKTLFWLLREAYGAYEHFGGNEVFLPLLDEIVEVLSGQDRWSRFEQIVIERLSEVIFDNHFIIDNNHLSADAHFFVNETAFDRDQNGLRQRETGRYVTNVIGHDIDKVFRLSVDETGDFFYIPVVAQHSNGHAGTENYELRLIFGNDEEEIMVLSKDIARRLLNIGGSSLRFENDIPIVTVREMGWPNSIGEASVHRRESAIRFLSFAEDLKDEPVVIVDIRSNEGGNGLLPLMWLHILAGEVVPTNFVALSVDKCIERPEEWLATHHVCDEDLAAYLHADVLNDQYFISFAHPDRIVSNDQIIILLVDRFTASAGEVFVDLMFSMENTLVIGQNTAGVLLTNSFGAPMFLPNSGIPVMFGPSVTVHPEGHFYEGVGFAPDVWVVGDALRAALATLGRVDTNSTY